jgi:hypothetical protein
MHQVLDGSCLCCVMNETGLFTGGLIPGLGAGQDVAIRGKGMLRHDVCCSVVGVVAQVSTGAMKPYRALPVRRLIAHDNPNRRAAGHEER